LPPAPTIVPLLRMLTTLPGGKRPVSNAGAPVEVEPITTPLAMVTFQDPRLAKPFDAM
jgi:hypothetical protein